MSYKGLIVKLQKLYAYHDCTSREKGYKAYSNENEVHKQIADEIERILISEQYAMKKHFKY